MRFRLLFVITIFISFYFPTSSFASNALNEIIKRGTLRVGTEANYYPFEFMDTHGNLVGFDLDIAAQMAQAMDVKLEIINASVDSMIPGLVSNKYDIFIRGITLTPKRNLKVNFTNAYFIAGQTILIRKELIHTIKSYKDLNNPKYKIVSKVGTTGEIAAKHFIPKAEYISYDTEQEALLEVINHRADAFVFDFPYNSVALKRFGQNKLAHITKPFTYEPLAWVVKKGDYDFINWLNNYLNIIQHNGTYDKLYQKWFINYDFKK